VTNIDALQTGALNGRYRPIRIFLTPTASRENISAIIELTDEKGSRVIGVAHRSGALSLRDEAAIFARSASLRRASASRNAARRLAECRFWPTKYFKRDFQIEENG